MSHLVVSNTGNVNQKKRKKQEFWYNKKVKSLKVNFLWQVYNLK